MYIAILGRQPKLGIAELESQFGSKVSWLSVISALIDIDEPIDITTFGGSLKMGVVTHAFEHSDWKKIGKYIASHYSQAWKNVDHKITLGISVYGVSASGKDIQRTGLTIKKNLKSSGVSLRLVPNKDTALSTATSHHNKLGLSDNKVELIVIRASDGRTVLAESIGAQNISAYAARDQERPKRDAFVGMLPPKLAQIMLNMAVDQTKPAGRVLDPFCGTGVVLQEAALLGHDVYGSDLSEKMVDYTGINLQWLADTHYTKVKVDTMLADATKASWKPPIDAVVCESYLGQPFSAPPAPDKLRSVVNTCDKIITAFFTNLAPQIESGTPLCVAVPSWRDSRGDFTHLPLIKKLRSLGYEQVELKTARSHDLLYYREDQVVARELLILRKI